MSRGRASNTQDNGLKTTCGARMLGARKVSCEPAGPDAVPKRLAVAAEVDDAFLAHLGQMLRGDARRARRKLTAPLLLMPSIQVNIRAGHLPPADANGVQYLKIPVRLVA